jgi:dihydroorotase
MAHTATSLLIRNAHLFDPAYGVDETGDVLVRDGCIAEIGANLPRSGPAVDAGGRHLFPGFCDPHVHFRTPGQTEKEDIESGSRAALAGGFTSVIQMPNTSPVIDRPELVRDLTRDEPIELRVLAAVTWDNASFHLADLPALLGAGAVGFTDDGQPIGDPGLMREALEFSSERHVPIANHAEDKSIGEPGVMRAGPVAEAMGVPGVDPRREWVMVERDIRLARETGGHLHVCHVSTRRSLDAIRDARAHGVRVTAEVTPHHLVLTSEDVLRYGTNAKMSPPLGDSADRDALVRGFANGTIDCLATDHAPHTPVEKEKSLAWAPFGVIGLETAFGVVHTELVSTGKVSLTRLIDAMTHLPREIYGLERVGLFVASRADLVLVDLEKKWTVDPEKFQSKGRNCPFAGRELAGRVLWTMYRGKILWELPDGA